MKYRQMLKSGYLHRDRLEIARAVPEVTDAYPLFCALQLFRNPENGVKRSILILGLDPSRKYVKVGGTAELNERRVTVVGDYMLGTDFADHGTILCSDRTFNAIFYGYLPDNKGLDEAYFGLIRLKKGADLAAARDELDALLPPNVLVLTKEEFLEREYSFWNTATPIGYIFALGTVMGFIVGMIICYQILFSDISDHMREFATLKAMSYRPSYFVRLVLQEALLLSVFGFLPGLIAEQLLYEVVTFATGLQVTMSVARIGGVVLLTTLMCVISGFLTMRKVVTSDPAELF